MAYVVSEHDSEPSIELQHWFEENASLDSILTLPKLQSTRKIKARSSKICQY